jgi:AhpD family alkylhydroperoxidase
MSKLEPKARALVAVGASKATNCIGCLEKTMGMAEEMGASKEEIGAAVEIGKEVGAGAAVKPDPFALTSRYHAFQLSHTFVPGQSGIWEDG